MRNPLLDSYLDERCSPIPEHLVLVEQRTYQRTLSPQMLSGHMQGRFLAWLVGWLRPKRILEVGTFTAYSALCLAERMPAGGHVHTIEINDELESIIGEHIALAGYEDRITLHIGDASDVIPTLDDEGPWDIIFLDARKRAYPEQFELAVKNLAPGGHILLDNVLWDGQVLVPKVKRETARILHEFTAKLTADPRWETLMLPMSDGLMLVREIA